MSDNRFTTSQGFDVEFLPIPQSIRKFHLAHPEPKPPTYIVKSKLTGVEETFYHDINTIETDEEKAQWESYQKDMGEYNEKFLRVCLIKGIRVHASMDEWLAEQAELEIPVADSPMTARIEWITEKILATKEDFESIMIGVMKASGAPEELLSQVEALFRGQVEQPSGTKIERVASDDDGWELVLRSQIRGSVDGVGVADTAKPVRRVGKARPGVRYGGKTRKAKNVSVGSQPAG